VLDRALEEAGIDRSLVYVTNAVKHFKFTSGPPPASGGSTRHPERVEITACRPWLIAEFAAIRPTGWRRSARRRRRRCSGRRSG
jgi:DNA polymerase